MPNQYFSFKQFTVQQDKCAMKVCTDACILGAWVADKIAETAVNSILDIGCGTGLLSLMLAQKSAAKIDALEINIDAAAQAAENCAGTPWAGRLNVIHIPMQEYQPVKKYDLIISNPPYYEDDLKSADDNRNAARHDTHLRFEELLDFIGMNLAEKGIAAVMIPFHRTGWFETAVSSRELFIKEKLLVRHTDAHHHFRSILLLSKEDTKLTHTRELSIYEPGGNYSTAFNSLLKDYYLAL